MNGKGAVSKQSPSLASVLDARSQRVFDQLKDVLTVEKTIAVLQSNGITAYCAATGEEAKQKAIIP